jgi:hypothetical protein
VKKKRKTKESRPAFTTTFLETKKRQLISLVGSAGFCFNLKTVR